MLGMGKAAAPWLSHFLIVTHSVHKVYVHPTYTIGFMSPKNIYLLHWNMNNLMKILC